jgi:hypothetical protein
VPKYAKFLSGSGCLLSIAGPLLAIFIYPHAKWLFAFVLFGVAVLVFSRFLSRDPTSMELADEMNKLLEGAYGGWDVDDYEHWGIRDAKLREFWYRTMEICPRPEEWVNLDDERKARLRQVIDELRSLGEMGVSKVSGNC